MNSLLLAAACLFSGPAAPKIDTLALADGSKAGFWQPAAGSRKLPLVVWLHGGIGANNPSKGVAAATNMASSWRDSGAFALLAPSAWPASPWWSDESARRVAELVEKVSHRKGIDASRIVLAGASDGGSGALWLAGRLKAAWKTRLKAVAVWSTDPDVLAAQGIAWNPASLSGMPLRWTAGDKDRLYPLDRIRYWWDICRSTGVRLEPHEAAGADHDLRFHQGDLAMFPSWVRKNAR